MGEKDIKKLIEGLKSPNNKIRCDSAIALGKAVQFGEDISTAVAGLGKALSDNDNNVRKNSASALRAAAFCSFRKIEIFPAIPALVKAFDDEDKEVRYFSVTALRDALYRGDINLNPLAAYIKNLGKMLFDKEKDIRLSAAEAIFFALSDFNISNIIPVLVKALWNHESNVRERIAQALGDYIYLDYESNKHNAKLVLAEINKSKNDKNIPEVMVLIKKCEEILGN